MRQRSLYLNTHLWNADSIHESREVNHNLVHNYRVTNCLLTLHHFCSLTCLFNTLTRDSLFTEILDQARWYLASTRNTLLWHFHCVYFTHKTVTAPIASTHRRKLVNWIHKTVIFSNCSCRLVLEDENASNARPVPERKQCLSKLKIFC